MNFARIALPACAVMVCVGTWSFAEQQPQRSPLQERLIALLQHQGFATPFEVVTAIDDGLESDASVDRELALSALTSRIAPFLTGNNPTSPDMRVAWAAELTALQALRPRLEAMLVDFDMIRRRLALPIEKRTNFLRKRLVFGGSAL